MSETTAQSALAYYARHGAALFPIPAGQKAPFGIEYSRDPNRRSSFKHDHSTDPKQWEAWQTAHPGCNFGVVAFASQWIICDIDTSGGDEGRAEAWALWCSLCSDWDIAPAAPHIQSPSGGWHCYFAVPDHIDASTLKQPDAIKKRINIRCVGYTVAAGSTFEGRPYLLMSDAAPYPAPAALIEHCTPAPLSRTATATGDHDRNDVAGLLNWLNEHNAFEAYEDWLAIGMALKIAFGDSGLELWQLTHDGTVDGDTEHSKWRSFATDPTGSSVTLQTFLKRAHALGWRGQVRPSTSAMFDGVAAIAAAAGANLSSGMPLPPSGGVPMLAGQEELTRLSKPILAEFLAATTDSPARAIADDYPTLPATMESHGLYVPMLACIDRVMAMSEPPQKFKPNRATDVLAVLNVLHIDVFEAVCRRLRAMGHTLPDRKIKLSAANLSEKVERITVTQDKWEYDKNGEPQADNSDNVAVFLGILGVEIRWNAWLERMEIKGGIDADLRWPTWAYIDDAVVAKLRTRANRTKTRFRPGKEFFWESLLALAHQNAVDPALDMLATLQAGWDRVPRLAVWLTAACGVPCDPYHQAVAKNIIGGMVLRARNPGCKHDTMAVFFGFQGSGKSTMAALLSVLPEWFTDTVKLGDEAKELVLSLAGKLVVEIGEMGMRGGANPNHVKAMLSRQVDAGRTAYARAVSERHRRNIFVGTTNDDEPLVDPTGNRRFLPVKVEREIDLTWLRENIGQIVGEAATLEAAGADFAIPREVWGDAAMHQEAARSATDMEILLGEWFTETPHTGPVSFITAADMVHLANLAGWRNGGHSGSRGTIMKRLGFRSEKPIHQGKRTVVWVRGECRPADIPKLGVRYLVGADSQGRPQVIPRREVDMTAPSGMPPLPRL